MSYGREIRGAQAAVAAAWANSRPLRRVALGALAATLWLGALASPALAGPPTHQQLPDPIGGFALNHACGTAADNRGDLYVSNEGNDRIEVFDPSGAHLTSIANANEPCGLAVDSHGDLFVTERATGEVVRYVPNQYPFSGTLTYGPREAIDSSGEAAGIAVDTGVVLTNSSRPIGGNDTLYVAAGDHVSAYRNEKQRVTLSGAGVFTLEFAGQLTNPLDCNASHQEVQEALEGLSTVGAGAVSVTTANFSATDHLIVFTGKLGLANVALSVGGACSVSQSEENGGTLAPLAEDPAAEYTGVAAYTHQLSGENFTHYLYTADTADDTVGVFSGTSLANLKLRRTITGPSAGEDFGFGPAGAYLAVDPGNALPGQIESGAASERCVPVAEQACTAGHLLVYDDAHGVVDEFDASGQFLDKITSPQFAAAEPTGLAIERSGGADDGTIYVTAGAAAAAKLLAFAPLVTPSRTPLPELSHALTGASAVATDEFGDVYVASKGSAVIHVFGPDGDEITNFEDPNSPIDLAVDSECNVYVVDGSGAKTTTYYEPPSCPPAAGGSFVRHEPAIASPAPGLGLKAVAVNPSNDRVFLIGNTTLTEFASVAEGSAPLRQCKSGVGSIAFGVGTDVEVQEGEGGEGSRVYVSTNPGFLYVIDCGAAEGDEEIVAQTGIGTKPGGGGCPAGPMGATPSIAIDQTNGHVIEFQSNVPAREYDAALSCVGEFGTFGDAPSTPYSVAVDNGSHSPNKGTVYVAFDANNNTIQPFDLTALSPLSYGEAPLAQTGVANGIAPGEATLNGTVNPNGFELEECRFEYLTEAEYETNGKTFAGAEEESCLETPAEIGHGTDPVSVHAVIGPVEPTTTRYRFRLVAENKFGSSNGDPGLLGPPRITPRSAQPVAYTEATLRAEIDPSGIPTSYHFDYGTVEGVYSQSTPTVTLPAGDAPVSVEAPLTGLEEATVYHFQLVVENEAATAKGPEAPDQSFETLQRSQIGSCPNTEYRTGLSARLPECRAYELVTPADTRGATPAALTRSFNNWLADPRGPGAGESLGFFATTLPGFEGTGETDGYRAARAGGDHPAAGWQSEFYGPSYAQLGGNIGTGQEAVSPDQRYWLWNRAGTEVPGSLPLGHYLRVPKGTANLACNADPEAFQSEFELVGCGSKGIDPQATSPFLSAGGEHVAFISKAQLEPEAAPAGTQAVYDRQAGKAEAEVISTTLGGGSFAAGENATYVGGSEDGSTVLFEVGSTLYAHRGGESLEVTSGPNTFAGISEDGTRVFYVGANFAETGPPSPAGLFACEVQASVSCTQIAPNAVFINVSPGGSGILFTSKEDLTPGEANEAGEEATANERNLYQWEGSTTHFVAILAAADFKGFGYEVAPGIGSAVNLGTWVHSLNPGPFFGRANSPTRATPDGEVFVFQSHAKLTPYDNGGVGQIYRYDSAAPEGQRLLCVSCDPSSAPAGGDAMLQVYAGNPGGHTLPTTLIANVTDDGQSVFFHSPDRLLPEDANGVADVYQWRAQGSGTGSEECKRPSGCLALISSGQGEDLSDIYGMSADGQDVFFSTTEKLVGQDIPGSSSIYDARVGGGIPDPPLAAPCQGDACQGQGSVPPVLPQPGSTASVPNGNVVEPSGSRKCPKGKRKVKSRGKTRCVKPKKHQKKAHKNNKSKKANSNRGASR